MQSQSKNWYIVVTKNSQERKVSGQLTKKKIDHYLPVNQDNNEWSDRKKTNSDPVFDSYVFVYLSETEKKKVIKTEGVINFVYWLGKEATIRNEEISAIKKFLHEYPSVRLEKIKVNPEGNIRYVNDPVIKREGNLLEVKPGKVNVSLPSLGYMLAAITGNEGIESSNTREMIVDGKLQIVNVH